MEDRAFLRAVARGHVQGVFFRRFVYDCAVRLGLTGQVRNLPDGASVETLAEGERRRLEELVRHLWQGPPGAVVRAVDVVWGPYEGRFRGFRVVE